MKSMEVRKLLLSVPEPSFWDGPTSLYCKDTDSGESILFGVRTEGLFVIAETDDSNPIVYRFDKDALLQAWNERNHSIG